MYTPLLNITITQNPILARRVRFWHGESHFPNTFSRAVYTLIPHVSCTTKGVKYLEKWGYHNWWGGGAKQQRRPDTHAFCQLLHVRCQSRQVYTVKFL